MRSARGARVQGLRVAAASWPSNQGCVELVEVEVSVGDLRREMREKSAPFGVKPVCAA